MNGLDSIIAELREIAERVDSETHREWADRLEAHAAAERALREKLEGLRELSEKATAGPWEAQFSEYGGYDCMTAAWYVDPSVALLDCQEKNHADNPRANANAAFIVACVNAIRELLATPGS